MEWPSSSQLSVVGPFDVKALTVQQPWASLIVEGIKDVENRTRYSYYRGRLGIHAGLRFDQQALDRYERVLGDELPLGALVGSITLVDCIDDSRSEWAIPGMWHWILANPRKLARPRWMPGKLGIWNT